MRWKGQNKVRLFSHNSVKEFYLKIDMVIKFHFSHTDTCQEVNIKTSKHVLFDKSKKLVSDVYDYKYQIGSFFLNNHKSVNDQKREN